MTHTIWISQSHDLSWVDILWITYRVSGWKVSKMKHLFLSNHLLHSFVIYTFAKTETQSFGTNRQSSIDFNMRLFSRWNASLMRSTFSSEVRGFPGDFTRNKLPVVVSESNAFPCWRMTSISGSEMPLYRRNRLYCNSTNHKTHWTCSCTVAILPVDTRMRAAMTPWKLNKRKLPEIIFLMVQLGRVYLNYFPRY